MITGINSLEFGTSDQVCMKLSSRSLKGKSCSSTSDATGIRWLHPPRFAAYRTVLFSCAGSTPCAGLPGRCLMAPSPLTHRGFQYNLGFLKWPLSASTKRLP